MLRRIVPSLWLLPFLFPPFGYPQNRFIVRPTNGGDGLQSVCAEVGCNVEKPLDDSNQLFLVTAPSATDAQSFLSLLVGNPAVQSAEIDALAQLLDVGYSAPGGLWDTTPVDYYGSAVWDGYASQPAVRIIRLDETRFSFNLLGAGTVAVIDTGIDPGHPMFRNLIVKGYDFTRDVEGFASELADLSQSTAAVLDNASPAFVNQSTAAVLDQSTAAVLDDNPQYAAFGHGTMVSGVVHLVAPGASIMPLKAFRADGSGYVSDIIRAVHFCIKQKVNVINMSFSLRDRSPELRRVIHEAVRKGILVVASAGNDSSNAAVYPAAFTGVMGVGSTTDEDTRAAFSNYGKADVWVAAPGEAIITAYPFGSYAAAWGTSFSAPLVAGTAALLVDYQSKCNESQAADAIGHARYVSADLGHGRLDTFQALSAWTAAIKPD